MSKQKNKQHILILMSFSWVSDLKEAAEVVQGALRAQEAPGQNGADLFTHGVEVGDKAVGLLEQCNKMNLIRLS